MTDERAAQLVAGYHRAWQWTSPMVPVVGCGARSLVVDGETVFDAADLERRRDEERFARWFALSAELETITRQRGELLDRARTRQLAMNDVLIAFGVLEDAWIVVLGEMAAFL